MPSPSRLRLWLDERLPVSGAASVVRRNLRQPLPRHVNWLFTLGAALVLLLLVQAVSGILLMVNYKPSAQGAFASVERIVSDLRLGWLFRSVHVWGSHLILLLALAHMFRVFLYGGYKRPREPTWIVGAALLAVILAFCFTGYVLPWDQVAYWGTVIATEAPASIPGLGPVMRGLLIGGGEVGDPTLGRFYVVHVLLLPLALLALVGVHLLLVRWQGFSSLRRTDEREPEEEGGVPYFPHHFLKEGAATYVALGVLLSLALLWPAGLGEPADPLSTPAGIKPEWYFLPAYQLMKYVPGPAGVILPALAFLALLALPLVDTSPERHPGRRRRVVAGWLAVWAVVGGLGVLGHLSESTRTVFGRTIHFDVMGWPRQVAPPQAQAEGGG